jgi:hypothetical protein
MSQGNSQDDAIQQAQNLELRKALNDAYAAVEGAKAVQSFSALTFEDHADQQIQRISGADTQTRPNELNRVQQVVNGVISAAAKIKALPDDAFADSDPSRDVNTPP